MAIYDAEGNQLFSCYDAQGTSLNYAYDAEGNLIFQSGETGTHLKVMEYNVGQWYYGSGTNVPADKDQEYYDLQNGMIQRANADVLFICEYWDMFSQAGRTALSMLSQYYPYIETQGGSSGYYGRAICSKYPISNWTHHAYANDANRYYDSVDLTVNGVQITALVTHLSTDSKRNTQINELISYLSSLDRFICAGDYNTLTITDSVTTDAGDYTNIITPLLNAGFNCANCSTQFLVTYSDDPESPYVGCLDNIVTSSNIDIESAYVDTTKLTDSLTERADHMPLIANLIIDN